MTHSRRGFTLVEMIVYLAILGLLFVTVVNILLSITKSAASINASRNITVAGATAMERLTREIRAADSIDVSGSSFDSDPGRLTVVSSDPSGASTSGAFYLSGGILKISQGGVEIGDLTGSSVSVTSLIFRQIAGATSTAVKIEMSIQGGTGVAQKTEKFYDTTVLRGS